MKRDKHTAHFLVRMYAAKFFASHIAGYFVGSPGYYPDLPDMRLAGDVVWPIEWRGAKRPEWDINNDFLNGLIMPLSEQIDRLERNARMHVTSDALAAEILKLRSMKWKTVEAWLCSEKRRRISADVLSEHTWERRQQPRNGIKIPRASRQHELPD
jgi:hypothetical protein